MQNVTEFKAYEILRNYYPQFTRAHFTDMCITREIEVIRGGIVNRVALADIQRVLRSWREQSAIHSKKGK